MTQPLNQRPTPKSSPGKISLNNDNRVRPGGRSPLATHSALSQPSTTSLVHQPPKP